jgi:hypothetical protein
VINLEITDVSYPDLKNGLKSNGKKAQINGMARLDRHALLMVVEWVSGDHERLGRNEGQQKKSKLFASDRSRDILTHMEQTCL